jgi:coenzyme PQQ synthesis protein D (PqqD)
MTRSMQSLPEARKERLVTEKLADELLVYDLERDKAHCLNQTAAMVWEHCDGRTTVEAMARILEKKFDAPATDEVVLLALDQLRKAQLIDHTNVETSARASSGMSRREVIKRIGIAASVALPVVTSIVAPKAVQAATCLPSGSACTTSAQCCSGICSGSVCA